MLVAVGVVVAVTARDDVDRAVLEKQKLMAGLDRVRQRVIENDQLP